MAKKYLDYDGLLYFWQKLKVLFVTDVTYNSTSKKIQKTKAGTTSDVVTLSTVATSGSYNDLSNKPTIPSGVEKSTTTPKMDGTASVGSETKFAAGDHVHPTDTSRVPTTRTVNGHALSADVTVTASDIGVESGAEVNQNAFSNVKVGTTTVSADSKTDTLELVAGSNVTLTPDATNDKVTISATDTTYSDFTGATSSSAGTHGLVPAPNSGKTSEVILSDGRWHRLGTGRTATEVRITHQAGSETPETLVTIGTATTTLAGFMPPADHVKLSEIAEGAEVNQNAFSNVKVGTTTIEADAKTDTIELVGSNVTLTPDATNDKVTIGITASNVTTALGNTAVARATGDASGNNIANTYAPKASPALTGTPTAPTASAGTNTTQIATTAFVTSAVQTAITGAAAFQGTAPTSFAPTNYKKGYYWVVGTAGTYAGQTCEPGDMIFAIKDYGTAYAASDFNVIQTNLDITSITNAEIDTIMAS